MKTPALISYLLMHRYRLSRRDISALTLDEARLLLAVPDWPQS